MAVSDTNDKEKKKITALDIGASTLVGTKGALDNTWKGAKDQLAEAKRKEDEQRARQRESRQKELKSMNIDGTPAQAPAPAPVQQKQGDVVIPYKPGYPQTIAGQTKTEDQSVVPSDGKDQNKVQPATVVSPETDPAKTIATMTTNLSTGKGNHTGVETEDPPPVLTEAQIFGEMLNMEGKKLTLSDIETPDWYADDSFYEGMLSFGLNLLSGNDWATSFNQGAEVFQNSKALEKRQVWAQELLDFGYDALEVQKWVETGDNSELTDPEEKKARALQMALNKQQYLAAVRANDENMLNYQNKIAAEDRARGIQREDEKWKLDQAVGYSQIESYKASAEKSRAEAEKARKKEDAWRGSGADGRPLTGVQEDRYGNRRSVIESPQGWVDLTTRQPIDPRQGQVFTEAVSKDETAKFETQRKDYNVAMKDSSEVGNKVAENLSNVNKLLTAELPAIGPSQYMWWNTDDSRLREAMKSGRAGLVKSSYSGTTGVGGASKIIEQSLNENVPGVNDSMWAKREWAIERVQLDMDVLEEQILDQRRKYGDQGVNPKLIEMYRETTRALKELKTAHAQGYSPLQQ